MSEDKENIIQYAWDEIEHYGMALANEIQADESVLSGPKLKLDDVAVTPKNPVTMIEEMEGHVLSLLDALSTKNKDKLLSCVSSIEHAGYADEDIYWLIDEVKNNYNIINIYDAELLYRFKNDEFFIPEIILPANIDTHSLKTHSAII